jgi:hypothetical protein
VVTATTVVDPALLERRISVDRLTPYKLAAGGDLSAALDLYQWNASTNCATGSLTMSPSTTAPWRGSTMTHCSSRSGPVQTPGDG